MKLNEYLTSLGNTADEVAESLRRQGVKGIRSSSCYCPILNAIYNSVPDYWSGLRIVNGSKGEDGHWWYVATLNDAQIMDPQLPQPVMDFIGQFDEGKYLDLETQSVKTVRTRVW